MIRAERWKSRGAPPQSLPPPEHFCSRKSDRNSSSFFYSKKEREYLLVFVFALQSTRLLLLEVQERVQYAMMMMILRTGEVQMQLQSLRGSHIHCSFSIVSSIKSLSLRERGREKEEMEMESSVQKRQKRADFIFGLLLLLLFPLSFTNLMASAPSECTSPLMRQSGRRPRQIAKL